MHWESRGYHRRVRKGSVLSKDFYLRPTLEVARDLLGRVLICETPQGRRSARIVETEGYLFDDPACHASRGRTRRNDTMFCEGSHAYVYISYGVHPLLNAVTGPEGIGEAVLLRAGDPLEGLPLIREARGDVPERRLCAGPGNLTKALGITMEHNGHPLTGGRLRIEEGEPVGDSAVVVTTRIGLTVATDKPWRFYLRDSKSVSRR